MASYERTTCFMLHVRTKSVFENLKDAKSLMNNETISYNAASLVFALLLQIISGENVNVIRCATSLLSAPR